MFLHIKLSCLFFISNSSGKIFLNQVCKICHNSWICSFSVVNEVYYLATRDLLIVSVEIIHKASSWPNGLQEAAFS